MSEEQAVEESLNEFIEAPPVKVALGPVRVSYTHDAVIDVIIAQPTVSNRELAQMFGYSEGWMSLIKSSDGFKAKLAQRKAEIVDPLISMSVQERFEAVTNRGLELLAEKMEGHASAVSDRLVLKAVELGAKALGLGGNAPPPAPVIPEDHLQRLAARMESLRHPVYTVERVSDGED